MHLERARGLGDLKRGIRGRPRNSSPLVSLLNNLNKKEIYKFNQAILQILKFHERVISALKFELSDKRSQILVVNSCE